MLPSEALDRATTFDFHVLNTATRWEKKKLDEQNNPEEAKRQAVTKNLTQEQMLEMVRKAKERGNVKR